MGDFCRCRRELELIRGNYVVGATVNGNYHCHRYQPTHIGQAAIQIIMRLSNGIHNGTHGKPNGLWCQKKIQLDPGLRPDHRGHWQVGKSLRVGERKKKKEGLINLPSHRPASHRR